MKILLAVPELVHLSGEDDDKAGTDDDDESSAEAGIESSTAAGEDSLGEAGTGMESSGEDAADGNRSSVEAAEAG